MMRQVTKSKKFVKDTVKYAKNNPRVIEELRFVAKELAQDNKLPVKYRDHPLIGNWKGYMECHIRPDVLLIYRLNGGCLELVRLGSHSELFR